MLPHPLLRLRAMLTRSQQRPRVATRPEGYRQPTTPGPVRRLETVAKTAWHHSSYHCVRLVLVKINSSMQYATTQRQGPPAYIIGTDSYRTDNCIRVVAYTFCVQLLLYQRFFAVLRLVKLQTLLVQLICTPNHAITYTNSYW